MNEATSSQVANVHSAVRALDGMVREVHIKVQGVAQQQVLIDAKVQSLTQLFNDYVQQDRLDKELHLAETRIVKVRQDLETTFGHYGDVRRRATGILQALDIGIVTHETVQATTEDVMMSATGYWLAPALVALAAWGRNDRPLAETAVQEALARDTNKTTLFFALVLRRFGRQGPSVRCLGHFFGRQDPRALTRDVVVLIDAVATGAFGYGARGLIWQNIGAPATGQSAPISSPPGTSDQDGHANGGPSTTATGTSSSAVTSGDSGGATSRANSAANDAPAHDEAGKAIVRYWQHVNDGDYADAVALETSSEQADASVATFESERPHVHVLWVGKAVPAGSGREGVRVNFYAMNTIGTDQTCRHFSIDSLMVRSGGQWLYDGHVPGSSTIADTADGDPSCPS